MLTVLVVAVAGLTAYAFQQRQRGHASPSDDANSRRGRARGRPGTRPGPAAGRAAQRRGVRLAHTPQATASLLESSGTPSAARIVDSAGIVQWVALSPDHKLLAAAGADGTLRLWDVATAGHPSPVGTLVRADASRPLYVAAFSPDGQVLAAAGAGQVVQLWDVSDPARPRPLGVAGRARQHDLLGRVQPRRAAARRGQRGRHGPALERSDPARRCRLGRPLTVPGTGAYVQSVAFSPDGELLAAGTADGHASGCGGSAATASPVALPGMPLTGPAMTVSGVAFSPAGRLLAASSQDKKVWLWKLGGAQHRGPSPRRHAGRGDELGQHGRVQPGRRGRSRRARPTRACWCGTWPPAR